MVVRMRSTRSHTKNRRSHHGLKKPTLSVCSNCNAAHRPHHMCLECGFYNGRQVLDLAGEKQKREARMQAKREQIKAEGSTPAPELNEVREDVSPEDTSKEAKEENLQDKKPDEKPRDNL